MTTPKVQLTGTEVHLIHSDVVGDDFEISVILPPPQTEGPVPVVYVTDGNNSIGLAWNMVGMLVLGGEIPPVMGVCVGYPTGNDFAQFLRLRTRDFSPTPDRKQQQAMADMVGVERIDGGGAAAFLRFLTTELRPWIKGRFPATDDATLVGDSMGGLFATYTLLHRPEAFSRYVIGSPWLSWAHPSSFTYEEEYAAHHDDLDATVFLGAGAAEDILRPRMPESMASIFREAKTAEYTRQMATALKSRSYPNLRLTTRIFDDETHFTIPAILHAHGIRAVFDAV